MTDIPDKVSLQGVTERSTYCPPLPALPTFLLHPPPPSLSLSLHPPSPPLSQVFVACVQSEMYYLDVCIHTTEQLCGRRQSDGVVSAANKHGVRYPHRSKPATVRALVRRSLDRVSANGQGACCCCCCCSQCTQESISSSSLRVYQYVPPVPY